MLFSYKQNHQPSEFNLRHNTVKKRQCPSLTHSGIQEMPRREQTVHCVADADTMILGKLKEERTKGKVSTVYVNSQVGQISSPQL